MNVHHLRVLDYSGRKLKSKQLNFLALFFEVNKVFVILAPYSNFFPISGNYYEKKMVWHLKKMKFFIQLEI